MLYRQRRKEKGTIKKKKDEKRVIKQKEKHPNHDDIYDEDEP
jgi:hypothetical protein